MNLGSHTSAEIESRRDLAPDLWILRLRSDEPLSFRPGQFATLGVLEKGKMIERPYSIASSPRETELEFFLELVAEGELTRRLHGLRAGDHVYVRKAARGVFGLDKERGRRKHLMVATVTGVAPFVSIVRTLRHDEKRGATPAPDEIVLLQGASRSWELGYDRELADLENEASWFHYVPTVSRPREDTAWTGTRGRVHDLISNALERFGFSPSDTTGYLCGHPGMIEAARGILLGAGFEKESIREERFWVPRSEP
jgi:ferredoxin--NADP+ reductase